METKGSSSNPVKRKGKGKDLTNFPPKRGLIKASIFGIGGRSNQACSSGGSAANCDTNSSEESSPSASYSSNGLSRNVSEAIASLKNSLNLDSESDSATASFGKIESSRKLVWGNVARSRDICASLWAHWTRRERSPPTIEKVLESSAQQVVATLSGVHLESVQFFTPTAHRLIDEQRTSALTAALAQLSGLSSLPA
ncbi:hypothetical protein ACFX2B_000239 [Malus domestica]